MGKSSLVVCILGFHFTVYGQQASESIVLPETAISQAEQTTTVLNRCPGIETLTNKDAPDLIYNRVVRCADLKEYDRAAELMFIAMSFGKFDTMRVSGKVRHHAPARSRIKALNKLNGSQLEALHQALLVKFQSPDERQYLCRKMRGIGQPSYQPDYMLNYHNPISSRQTHLTAPSTQIPIFEQELAWESVFYSFARCPV
ncbi:hypothetical protein [Thalassotalea litorea]|uniref:hypothetical protein n=1 Tax=Thalassotalea litorea TaxID=2020715 RepID=UPI00373562B2